MTQIDWREQARCRNMGTGLFFPVDGFSYEQARKVCEQCSVPRHCLDMALAIPEERDQDGMFGGMTPKERQQIRWKRYRGR